MAKKDVLSKYSDFKSKQFLVIDDFPEFRTAIKRMVEAFGGEDIDTASNGDDAIAKIASKRYDAILCDYNLGDGKDGQQVLEEAKFNKNVQPSQIYLMLTAESTAEMVMGALECEPDGYLVKPFTKEMVHNRLSRLMQIKKELVEIHKAYESKDFETASKLCDEKIAQGGRTALHCLKFKGKLLLENEKYDDAKIMFDSLAGNKKLPWVALGLAKIYYAEKDYDKAKEMFNEIISQNEKSVEAYDWLAKIESEQENYIEAQEILEKAVKMSSKAILRQQTLGRIALKNEGFETAEKSLRAAVELGKHSCHRKPGDYILLGKLLNKLSKDTNTPKLANESVDYFEKLSNLYLSNKKINMVSSIVQAQALILAGRVDKAKVNLRKVSESLPKTSLKLPKEYLELLGTLLKENGNEEAGDTFLEEAKSAPEDDEELM